MKIDIRFWRPAVLVLVALALFGSPRTAAAAISFVQGVGSTNDAPSTSIAQAFTAANTAGNLIVVAVSWGDRTAPSIQATDTLGNTYVVASSDYDPNNSQGLAILYAANIRAGANTVTVNFGASDGYRRIVVSEYSGIATTSPLDVAAHNQAVGTTAANAITSGTVTTTVSGDLIFGAVMDDSGLFGTITAGTGFTRRVTLNNMDVATEDLIQATAGPVAATFTFSRADRYLAQMAAFKPAAGGGGGTPAVSSLVCNPTSLTSGGPTTCTVTLNQAAPTGGSTVTLSSNNPTALPVPASVSVAATTSSATFTATAGSVATSQTVTLTATLGGSTTATVTVAPAAGPVVSSLVCNPTSLTSGAPTTCTVTLNQAAPTGGSTVTLSSNNPTALPVPASVPVAATTSSATFTATAGSVATSQTVTLTATLGGSTTATVTVAPATLTSLAVTPANPSIVTGATQQFTATGTFSNGTTQNLTTAVTWSSSATGVATISNTTGSKGLATSVGTGSTTISATSGSVSGSTTLTVTAGGGGGPITFVQTAGLSDDSAAATISQAFNANNIAGNLIVVAVSWGDNAAPSIRASDSLGNTYSVATNDFDAGNRQGLAILYAPNIRAGANTVTVTLGVTGGYRRVIVSEYSGAAAASPLDVAARNQAAGTTAANGVTSTAATTTSSGDLIFGVAMDDSGLFGTINAGTGFTRRASLNNMDMATEDTIQATAGSVAATFTFTRADIYLAQMAAFRSAAGGGGGGTPSLSSIGCSPSSLASGASATCTVVLNQAAPTGGSTVTLSSNNPTALPVPPSVIVPATATSTTFAPTAGSVTTNQTVTLTATLGATATTTVTVVPPGSPTLTSLAVTPANPSIVAGTTQQFTAIGTFSDGTTQNLTASVAWGSSASGVATISTTGLATGAGTGSTTISATSGSVAGSTTLTVTTGGGGGGGAITFVQTAGTSDNTVAGTISQGFSANNVAGNLIVVAVSWGDNPAPSIRASDGLGNTYTVATNDFDAGAAQGLAILYAPNIRAGANTVTVTLGVTGGYRRIIVSEYSGLSTTTPLDTVAKNRAGGTTASNGVTSTGAFTTSNGDLIFGATMDDSGLFGTINAGTGFTRRATLNNMDMATEDAIQSTAGSVAATFTFSRADAYLAQMATFRSAAAGGGGGVPSLSSISCSPASLTSATSTVCTIALTQVAPTGGTIVTLSSNNAAVLPVPASVTVPANAATTTFTSTAGTVTTVQTATLTASLSGISKTTTVTVASSQAQLKGAWAGPFTWPIVAIHMALLPNGKVLAWDLNGNSTQVWDPTTNVFTDVTDPSVTTFLYFCAGQTALGDGRVVIDGGHINYDIGVRDLHAFDSATQTWTALAQMSVARWYPTVITLGDGRVLAVSGVSTCPTCVVSTPEVYNPTSNVWTQLSGAQSSSPTWYPHVFVLPDGRALVAGSWAEVIASRVIDIGANTTTTVDPTPREGGSSVMYLPGKVMKAGSVWADGQANVGPTTFVLDMTQPSPAWRQTSSMQFGRVTHNLTILADGTVLVTGGSGNEDVSDPAAAVYNAELWSPTNETWTTMAAMQVARVYHATAILLPDGRVLSAGSGRFSGTGPGADQLNAEIYSPPYLFNGSRPVITSAPTSIGYGSTFSVATPDAAQIAKVALIRLGTVTHHFNSGQRYLNLSFQAVAGGLTVTAPANGNLAPPGYYMLFILNANGVPSVAPLIQVH